MSMWSEFKAFLLKENVLALAIAVVVGAALNKLVTAVVEDFIMASNAIELSIAPTRKNGRRRPRRGDHVWSLR